MDSLLQTVASIAGCSSTDIEIVGLKPDKSFILIITMRDDFLNILKETNPLDFKILLIYNVDWIKIEDKIVTFDTGKLYTLEGIYFLLCFCATIGLWRDQKVINISYNYFKIKRSCYISTKQIAIQVPSCFITSFRTHLFFEIQTSSFIRPEIS